MPLRSNKSGDGNAPSQSKAFPAESRYDTERKIQVRFQRISCNSCDASDEVHITGAGYPPQQCTKVFVNRGWSVGSNRKKDVCPLCQARRREDSGLRLVKNKEVPITALAGALIEAARPPAPVPTVPLRAVNPVPKPLLSLKAKPVEEAMSQPQIVSTTAEADLLVADKPRPPSREEKRAIVARLDEVYDTHKKCYTATHNDKNVAAGLKFPWRWIADMREDMFGPEGSEQLYEMMTAFETAKLELPKAIAKVVVDTDTLIRNMKADFQRQLDTIVKNRDASIERINGRITDLDRSFERMIAQG